VSDPDGLLVAVQKRDVVVHRAETSGENLMKPYFDEEAKYRWCFTLLYWGYSQISQLAG
jgi:hypothetical protein